MAHIYKKQLHKKNFEKINTPLIINNRNLAAYGIDISCAISNNTCCISEHITLMQAPLNNSQHTTIECIIPFGM